MNKGFKNWTMTDLAEKYPEAAKAIFDEGKSTPKAKSILPPTSIQYSTCLNKNDLRTIKLWVKPLSTNLAWIGRRVKSDAYKAYEQEVLWSLPEIMLPEPPYCVSYEFGFSSAGSDIDNSIKQTTDILCKRYKFNDNQIYQMNIKKVIVPKTKEYLQFKIENLT